MSSVDLQTLAQGGQTVSWWSANWLLATVGILVACTMGLLIVFLIRQTAVRAAHQPTPADRDGSTRDTFARNVMIFSILGVILLAVVVLFTSSNNTQSQYVFAAVLPLLGTWVGTILAYYFSRENLDAATKSVSTMADRLSPGDKLESIPVQSRMRRLADIKYREVSANQEAALTLDALKADNVDRLVILDPQKRLRFLIYKSVVDAFMNTPPGTGTKPAGTLTLADLLADPDRKKLFETSWAAVGPNASLADVKRAMRAQGEKCNDAFVTTDGNRSTPILGWVTDNRLNESAKG